MGYVFFKTIDSKKLMVAKDLNQKIFFKTYEADEQTAPSS